MPEAPIEKVTVIVQGREIVLDPINMKYNENSLAQYMNEEYGWIDYLGKQLEHAQKEVLDVEIESEAIYSLKFMESKDCGNSDNYAKAFALANVDVVEAKKKVAKCKENVGHLKAHLKAWDKNHDNAKSRSFAVQNEMKVLNRNIYTEDNSCNFEDAIQNL